ncbi:MAG: TonB-dependent receptor [Myxococcota bacterium]
MRRWSLIATIAVGLGISVPAHADPRDDARRHFATALDAVGRGDYDLAIAEFKAANEAFPLPQTLYNIGKAYADSGDLDNALSYYRQFRAAAPDSASLIDPIIANLERRVAANAAPPPSEGVAVPGGLVTTDEADRFNAIVDELRALTDALDAKGKALAQNSTPAVPGARIQPSPAPGGAAGAPPAEEPDDSAFIEDAYRRIVVTASRVGQDPLDSPSTVSVITADDIRLSGALDVPDLLRRVVGVEVMAPSGGHSEVAIRGLQRKMNNTVLFLLDGRNLYQGIGWMFWGPVPLQLEEIERIEVIRGPGSAVYGADAVTGVVNIITRTPGDGESIVTATAGTTAIQRYAAVATGRAGTAAYRLSAGYQQQGAWSRDANVDPSDPNSPIYTTMANDSLGLQTIRINVRGDKSFGKSAAVSLSAGLSEATEEFISFGSLTNEVWNFHHRYVRGDVFAGPVHVRSYWTNSNGDLGNVVQYVGERGVNTIDDTNVFDTEVEVPLKGTTGPIQHQFNVGARYQYLGYRWGWSKGGYARLYEEARPSVFVNEQATIDRLSVVGSLRVDRHPLVDISQTTSPRVAVLYRLFDKTSLRLTTGTAFRNPSAGETNLGLRVPTSSDAVYVQSVPAYDLLPERIVTYEAGIHDESSYFHRADVVVFHNHASNLIYTADVPPAIVPYNEANDGFSVGTNQFTNLPTVYNQYGLEGELELYPTDGLDLFANGSVSRTFTHDDTGPTGVDRSSSEIKFNVGGSYRTPYRTDLSVWFNWMGPQDWPLRNIDPASLLIVVDNAHLPARSLVSARVAVRPFADQPLELSATGWNLTELFGDGYYEHPQGQRVPARVYGSASWRF